MLFFLSIYCFLPIKKKKNIYIYRHNFFMGGMIKYLCIGLYDFFMVIFKLYIVWLILLFSKKL